MSATLHRQEAIQSGARMLRTALGPAIARLLEDPAVVEVMLNPDGRIWVDRLSEGLADTGEMVSAADGERIVRLVAHHVGAEVHGRSPRVSAELPETGERFEGLLPPVVAAPTFAIRKPAVAVFTLDDYVTAGIMTADQAATLRAAIASRVNILVAGGTSTGKTTLTNALLAEVAKGVSGGCRTGSGGPAAHGGSATGQCGGSTSRGQHCSAAGCKGCAASTIAMASSMVGVMPPKPCVNWLKRVEPMPMMTARTRTLMPLEITLPRTRSAMKAVLPNRPNGISTKPASVDSLNSISVTNSWTARMKKARMTSAHAKSRHAIWMKFSKKATQPMRSEMDSSSGRAASNPVCATLPGRIRS